MANILHEGRLLERYSSHRSNFRSKVLPLHVTKKSTFAEGPPMYAGPYQEDHQL